MAAKTVTVTVAMRNKLSAPSKKAARDVDFLSKTALTAGRRFKSASASYDEFVGKMTSGKSVIRDNTRAMREMSRGSARSARTLDRQATSHGRVERKATTSAKAIKKFRVANSLATASRGLSQFSRKSISALKEPVAQALEYGKGIAEASTLTDEASFSTAKMRDITMGMAKEFGGSTKFQTQALYDTISAGFGDATSASNLMNASNRLAVGGVTDVAKATLGLTSTLNAYHKGAESASEFNDIFFATVKGGITTVPQLASSFGKVTPIAAAMGVEFSEVGGILAALTAQGINTRESVTGIRSTLTAIKKPSTQARREAKKLGIDFSSAGLKAAGGLGKFLRQVVASDKFDSDTFSKLFGNVRALVSVTALASENFSTLDRTMGVMENRAGTTDSAFKMIADTDFQKLKRAEAQFEALKIELGEGLTPSLVDAAKWLNKEVVPGISKWLKENKKTLKTLLPIAVAVVGISAVLAPLLLTISSGITVLTTFGTGLKFVGTGLAAVGKGSALVSAGVAALAVIVFAATFALTTMADKYLDISGKTAKWLGNLTGVNRELDRLENRKVAKNRTEQLDNARNEVRATAKRTREVEGKIAAVSFGTIGPLALSPHAFAARHVLESDLEQAKAAEGRAKSQVNLLEGKAQDRKDQEAGDAFDQVNRDAVGPGLTGLEGEVRKRFSVDNTGGTFFPSEQRTKLDVIVRDDRIQFVSGDGTTSEVPIGAGFAAEGI